MEHDSIQLQPASYASGTHCACHRPAVASQSRDCVASGGSYTDFEHDPEVLCAAKRQATEEALALDASPRMIGHRTAGTLIVANNCSITSTAGLSPEQGQAAKTSIRNSQCPIDPFCKVWRRYLRVRFTSGFHALSVDRPDTRIRRVLHHLGGVGKGRTRVNRLPSQKGVHSVSCERLDAPSVL